jgi:membrane protease YdiL (CAAX protease family)
LAGAIVVRRTHKLRRYWEFPFAFFVFIGAGFFGDGNISPVVHAFGSGVLHQAPTTHNPFGATVSATVLAQLLGTLALVVPIILLTLASGSDLRSIFIDRTRERWPVIVGVSAFAVICFLAARGRTASFFPTHGAITFSRFMGLAPTLVVLVLLNGLREELWFRGLFLKKYAKFLRPWSANILAAVIFTSFHVQVQYSASILPFLGITLLNGLFLGWLMQRSGSLLAPVLFHAATDIPIFLVYLSYST